MLALRLGIEATMSPFVILALHRTGSTFLENALNGHPEIECAGAIFNRDAAKRGIDLADPVRSMDRWLEAHSKTPLVGFKVMLGTNEAVLNEVAQRRYPLIFLTRPNELARYSSQLIARETGQRARSSFATRAAMRLLGRVKGSYNSRVAKALFTGANSLVRQETEKIEFKTKRFQRMRRKTEVLISDTDATLARYEVEPLRVHYPQIATQEVLHTVLRFIGAKEMDLVSPNKKMNPPNILNRFSNPDEVRRFLEEEGATEWVTEG